MYSAKKKKTKIKCSGDIHCATNKSPYDMPTSTKKDSKVKAKDVFEGYGKKCKKKCPKGKKNCNCK
jgi:hypothetical protein